MDELLSGVTGASGSATTGENAAKKRALEAGSTGVSAPDNSVFVALVKLGLASALRCRILASLAYLAFNVPTQHPAVVAMKTATTRFSEIQKNMRSKGKSPDDVKLELGTPCVHAFTALCTALAETHLQKEALLKAIKSWKDKAEKEGMRMWMYIQRAVKLCRIEKMWEMSRKKLLIQIDGQVRSEPAIDDVTPAEFWSLYGYPAMVACSDIKEMHGIAPPGELERILQTYLDQQRER